MVSDAEDLRQAVSDLSAVIQQIIGRIELLEKHPTNVGTVVGQLEARLNKLDEVAGERINQHEEILKKIIMTLQGQGSVDASPGPPVSPPGMPFPPSGDAAALQTIYSMVKDITGVGQHQDPLTGLLRQYEAKMMESMMEVMDANANVSRLLTKRVNEKMGDALAKELVGEVFE